MHCQPARLWTLAPTMGETLLAGNTPPPPGTASLSPKHATSPTSRESTDPTTVHRNLLGIAPRGPPLPPREVHRHRDSPRLLLSSTPVYPAQRPLRPHSTFNEYSESRARLSSQKPPDLLCAVKRAHSESTPLRLPRLNDHPDRRPPFSGAKRNRDTRRAGARNPR